MDRAIEFSVFPLAKGWTYPELRAVALEAERLGFAALWQQDNIMGHVPYTPLGIPIFDTWPTLSALADATSKIRLGSLATPAVRRYPPLLAKTIACLDNISNGRINVGLGAGDVEIHYTSIGQRFPPPAERVAILREAIEVMKLMWTQEFATFRGEHFHIENAMLNPKPVQKPHPPVWVASTRGTRLMPRVVAECADGVAIECADDAIVAKVVQAIERNCELLNRDMSEITLARTSVLVFTNGTLDFNAVLQGLGRLFGFQIADNWANVYEPVIFGTPSQIAEELHRRFVAFGFRHIVVYPYAVDLEVDTGDLSAGPGNFIGSMRMFAQEIMPLLAHK